MLLPKIVPAIDAGAANIVPVRINDIATDAYNFVWYCIGPNNRECLKRIAEITMIKLLGSFCIVEYSRNSVPPNLTSGNFLRRLCPFHFKNSWRDFSNDISAGTLVMT